MRQVVMPYLNARFFSRVEADLAVQVLSDEGIESWVSASDAGGAIPAMQSLGDVRIEVDDRDLDRGNDVLADTELGKPRELPPLSSRDRLVSWVVVGLIAIAFGVLAWRVLTGELLRSTAEQPPTPRQHELPY